MPPRRKVVETPAETPVVTQTQPVKRDKTLPVIFILFILFLLSAGVAGYFYYQYKHTAQAADAEEIAKLTKEIGMVMQLPEGETPTLATVTDKTKLAEQPFFQRAENGDKVLIYSASGRAVLYRPSIKKIIDVTSVNVNPAPQQPVQNQNTPDTQSVNQQPTTTAETAPTILRLAMLNGSTTVGITNIKEKEITAAYKNVAVVSKETAKKNDYPETVVVDLSGKNADMAGKIAGMLDGKVGSMPGGEITPADADLLVIIGNK